MYYCINILEFFCILGSSPICHGSCREGFVTNKTSTKGGYGEHECVTGKKKY